MSETDTATNVMTVNMPFGGMLVEIKKTSPEEAMVSFRDNTGEEFAILHKPKARENARLQMVATRPVTFENEKKGDETLDSLTKMITMACAMVGYVTKEPRIKLVGNAASDTLHLCLNKAIDKYELNMKCALS